MELNPVAEEAMETEGFSAVREAPPPRVKEGFSAVREAPPPSLKGDDAPGEGDCEPAENAEPANLRAMRAPRSPTQQEVDDHQAAGHTPYRNWCRACVAGAGRRDRHEKQRRAEERAVPTISVDFAFLGGKGPDGTGHANDLPILVTRCDADRWISVDPIPSTFFLNHPSELSVWQRL